MRALAACVEKAGRQAVINGTLQSTRHSGAQRKQWWSPLNRGEARSICRQSRAAAPASSRSARLSSPESCGHMLGSAANSQEVNFLTKHWDKYDIQTSCVQPGWTRMSCQAQAAHVSHSLFSCHHDNMCIVLYSKLLENFQISANLSRDQVTHVHKKSKQKKLTFNWDLWYICTVLRRKKSPQQLQQNFLKWSIFLQKRNLK